MLVINWLLDVQPRQTLILAGVFLPPRFADVGIPTYHDITQGDRCIMFFLS
jgi:hypothetical protein